jgi:hypothetical protein
MKSIVVSVSAFMIASAKPFEALRREPLARICPIKSARLAIVFWAAARVAGSARISYRFSVFGDNLIVSARESRKDFERTGEIYLINARKDQSADLQLLA